MAPSPMVLVVVAFFCGVIVGAVPVALQRAAAIQRVKQQFRAELEAIMYEKKVSAPAAEPNAPRAQLERKAESQNSGHAA